MGSSYDGAVIPRHAFNFISRVSESFCKSDSFAYMGMGEYRSDTTSGSSRQTMMIPVCGPIQGTTPLYQAWGDMVLEEGL